MGKSSGGTRSSTANGPKGYSASVDTVLNAVDSNLFNLSNELTDLDFATYSFNQKDYSFGDGYTARLYIAPLASGNGQINGAIYGGGKRIADTGMVVYNPVNASETRQAAEDIKNRIISAIIKNRK